MKINSNDQFDLKSSCIAGCEGTNLTFRFNLYLLNGTLNKWIPFSNSSYFFTIGQSNSYLVIKKDLFRDFSSQVIWKIESNIELVTYTNETLTASTSMKVYVNFSPKYGICTISPTNGTTNTVFSLNCQNWIDSNGSVGFYSYYGRLKYFEKLLLVEDYLVCYS